MHRIRPSPRALAVLALLHAAPPVRAADTAHEWRTYANPRFGFSMCYPADLVRPEPPPANGDGITLVARDGGRIAAWGSTNALDQTLTDMRREDRARLAGPSGTITYEVQRGDTYVLSGRNGDRIFYNRTALRADVASVVELGYPVAERALWDAVAARVSRCFRPG